jgi:hypothetical protein
VRGIRSSVAPSATLETSKATKRLGRPSASRAIALRAAPTRSGGDEGAAPAHEAVDALQRVLHSGGVVVRGVDDAETVGADGQDARAAAGSEGVEIAPSGADQAEGLALRIVEATVDRHEHLPGARPGGDLSHRRDGG